MSRSEEAQAEVVVSRGDWEGFLSSLERLITLHQRTLQRLRDLRMRNQAIRTELRSALALPTIKPRSESDALTVEKSVPVQPCRYCAREIATYAKFCDGCGRANAVLLCLCGCELGRSDKFCDKCGRPVIAS